MKRVLTITLNPAIDVRYNVENLRIGNVNRTKEVDKTAGGKGINVSRVIKKLDGNVIATGIVGGFTGKLFLNKMAESGIENDFLETNYETRTCIAIISDNTDGVTEVLESGFGDAKVCEDFIGKYVDILERENIDIVCGSGSILKGIDPLIYNRLIDEARKRDIKFILDTSGETLKKGMEGKPFLVKPNQEELEDILGKEISTIEETVKAAKELVESGVENVMVTLGGDGAIFVNKDCVYRGTFPKVEIKNTVGSGDSTIAGFTYGISKGLSLKESFKLGMACGTTNAMLDKTGDIDLEILNRVLEMITVIEL